MVIILKIVHFLALALVVGGGVSSAVVAARVARVDASMRPALVGIQATIGKLSLGALLLLWLSGILLTYLYYDGWSNLPPSFWLKIIFVVILTGLSVRMQMKTGASTGTSDKVPNSSRALLGQMAAVSSFLVVIFAAIAFTA